MAPQVTFQDQDLVAKGCIWRQLQQLDLGALQLMVELRLGLNCARSGWGTRGRARTRTLEVSEMAARTPLWELRFRKV